MKLPSIDQAVTRRPGVSSTNNFSHFVPCYEYKELWDAIFIHLREQHTFTWPVKGGSLDDVDPYFGRFGYRYHPFLHKANNYHLGIDITAQQTDKVIAIRKGRLEYSGFHVINGLYVMVSHPDIVTEDGYMLYSLYMHLSDVCISFTTYEKMLREISLHTYPEQLIVQEQLLGHPGSTGKENIHTQVHLQCEFRNTRKKKHIAIDAMRLFSDDVDSNITADVETEYDFKALLEGQKHNEWGVAERYMRDVMQTHKRLTNGTQ